MTISGIGNMTYVQAMMTRGAMQRSDPFQKVDSDGDGSVNQSELESFASQIKETTGQTLDVEEALAAYDADGDGGLSEEEMQALVKGSGFAPPPPPPPPGFMEVGMMAGDEESSADEMAASAMQRRDPFQKVDEDGDGVISESELETFAAFIEETTGETIDVAEALASYDGDGDGALNEEEMASFVEESGFAPPPPPPHGGPPGSAGNDEEESAYQALLNQALLNQAISAYSRNSGENSLYDLLSSAVGETLNGAASSLSVTT